MKKNFVKDVLNSIWDLLTKGTFVTIVFFLFIFSIPIRWKTYMEYGLENKIFNNQHGLEKMISDLQVSWIYDIVINFKSNQVRTLSTIDYKSWEVLFDNWNTIKNYADSFWVMYLTILSNNVYLFKFNWNIDRIIYSKTLPIDYPRLKYHHITWNWYREEYK